MKAPVSLLKTHTPFPCPQPDPATVVLKDHMHVVIRKVTIPRERDGIVLYLAVFPVYHIQSLVPVANP